MQWKKLSAPEIILLCIERNTGEDMMNTEVAEVFESYPERIREKLLVLRDLVLETASETEEVGAVEETLRWGEPSYIVKGGSTVRMAWKNASPEQYALYFHCGTSLVQTFRMVYKDVLSYEGNRAVVFDVEDDISVDAVRHCILLALTYHRRKHLPMLGA